MPDDATAIADAIAAQRQEDFNKVWDWFVVERHGRSVTGPEGGCCYRAPNGNRCAVGVLLPDHLWRPGLNSTPILSLATRTSSTAHAQAIEEWIDKRGRDFLYRLQSAHDYVNAIDFRRAIGRKLREIAKWFDLTIPGE